MYANDNSDRAPVNIGFEGQSWQSKLMYFLEQMDPGNLEEAWRALVGVMSCPANSNVTGGDMAYGGLWGNWLVGQHDWNRRSSESLFCFADNLFVALSLMKYRISAGDF